MVEKIQLLGREITVKKMLYLDAFEVETLRQTNPKEAVKKMVLSASDLTEEELNKLEFDEGMKLQKLINQVNNLGADFQNPAKESKAN